MSMSRPDLWEMIAEKRKGVSSYLLWREYWKVLKCFGSINDDDIDHPDCGDCPCSEACVETSDIIVTGVMQP